MIVHTGQHYDAAMSDAFFRDLGLPAPHIHLGVGSGSHAEQTGRVMIAYEKVCQERRPDWVIVVGDVNSTMACTIAAKKLWLPVAHLEAGLRSGDRTMPEEINRLVTDAICDVLWTPSPDADENLAREGVAADKVERIGNVMMDSYELMRGRIEAARTRDRFGLPAGGFGVVTLHRPSNVDDARVLERLVDALVAASRDLPLVFAVHPRTKGRLAEFGLAARLDAAPGVHLTEPLGYIDFMGLVREAKMTITDSGGVQEETTYLNIPCLTVRDTTERPITVSQGTNQLVPADQLGARIADVLAGRWREGSRPELWDGRTAARLAASLKRRSQKGV